MLRPSLFLLRSTINDIGFKSLTRPPPKKDGPTSQTPNRIPAYMMRTSLQLVHIDSITPLASICRNARTTNIEHIWYTSSELWHLNTNLARSCRNPPIWSLIMSVVHLSEYCNWHVETPPSLLTRNVASLFRYTHNTNNRSQHWWQTHWNRLEVRTW